MYLMYNSYIVVHTFLASSCLIVTLLQVVVFSSPIGWRIPCVPLSYYQCVECHYPIEAALPHIAPYGSRGFTDIAVFGSCCRSFKCQ